MCQAHRLASAAFEPNPDYSTYYIGSEEIWRYVNAVADKYDVKRYMRFRHRLTNAVWNGGEGVWDLTFEVTKVDANGGRETSTVQKKAEILINAGGNLKCVRSSTSSAVGQSAD